MRWLLKPLFALALLMLLTPSSAPAETALTKVTVFQAVETLIYLPLYVAQEKGFFAKHGLDVTIVTAGSSSNAVAAVVSGSAMFSVQDPMTAGFAKLKGAPLKDICAVVAGVPVWITTKGDSSIKTLADLQGKRVTMAIPPATGTYLYKELAASSHINADIDLVTIGSEPAPLLAGKSDAAVVISPQVDMIASQGGRIVYSFTHTVKDGWAFTAVTAREDTIATKKATVQAFVDSMADAMTAIRTDTKGMPAEVGMKQFPALAPSLVRSAVQRLIDEKVYPTSPIITTAMFNNAIGMQERVGNIAPGALKFEDIMDMTFAKEAAKKMADAR